MIQRQRVLFLRLLLARGRVPVPRRAARCRAPALPAPPSAASASRCASFHLRAQLAQLALQRQRTAAGLAAAAHRVAVIADAVLQAGNSNPDVAVASVCAAARSVTRKQRASRGSKPCGACAKPLVRRSVSRSRPTTPGCGTDPARAATRRSLPDEPGTSRGRRIRRASAPRRARLRPSRRTTTYSSSSCRNSSHAFSQAGSVTSTKSASTPEGLKSCDLAVLDRGEQALHRFRGVGAMRQNLFERFLARLLRAISAARVSSSFCRAPRPCAPGAPSSLLPRAGAGPPAIRAPVAARASFADSSAFTCSRRARSPERRFFFFAGARRIALDRRQIFVDLRQLIAQRRTLRPAAAAPAGGPLRSRARARADRSASASRSCVLACSCSRAATLSASSCAMACA